MNTSFPYPPDRCERADGVLTVTFSFSQGMNCKLAGLLRRMDSYYLLAAMAVAPLVLLVLFDPRHKWRG